MCRLFSLDFCIQDVTNGSKKKSFSTFLTLIHHEHKFISVNAWGTKRKGEYDYCQNKLNRQEQKRILLAEIRNCSFSLHQHISNQHRTTFCFLYELYYKNDASMNTSRICYAIKLYHLPSTHENIFNIFNFCP